MSRPPTRLVATLLAAVVLGSPFLGSATAAQAATVDVPSFNVVAHRGSPAAKATENTLKAFNRAVSHGADAIEFDVRITADGRYVLMHDARLARTTTCTGRVVDRTLAWIRKKCRGEAGGEPIPTLAEAFTWAQKRDIVLIVELKHQAEQPWNRTRLRGLDQALSRYRLAGRSLLHSFDEPTLRRAERVDSGFVTLAIAGSGSEAEDHAAEFDGVAVFPGDLTGKRVETLRQEGAFIVGRVTNQVDDWQHLSNLGVPRLLTDVVPDYLSWKTNSS